MTAMVVEDSCAMRRRPQTFEFGSEAIDGSFSNGTQSRIRCLLGDGELASIGSRTVEPVTGVLILMTVQVK